MIPFWRSLVFRLLLAFGVTGVLGLGIQAILVNSVTLQQFSDYLGQSRVNELAQRAVNYYRQTGTLEGVERALPPPPPRLDNRPAGPGQPPSPPPPRNAGESRGSGRPSLVGVVDTNGVVIVPILDARPGDRINIKDYMLRQDIMVDGQRVGTVIRTRARTRLTPEEQAFVLSLQRSLVWSSLTALLAALGLGLLMARSLVQPLRRLTEASRQFTLGKPAPKVPEGPDEVGQLSRAFNHMSTNLSDADRQRRQMLADIAHDLGTPLTVVSGYVQSMRDGKLQVTQDRLETVYDELKLLQNLVDDLRLLSLADTGRLKLEFEEIAPQIVLANVQKAFQHRAEKLGVTIRLEAEDSLPYVKMDAERMRQVLGNLVSNALRYTPAKGQIRLIGKLEGNHVLLQVADTGSGIAPEKLPHIFERFYRADESRNTDNGEGSGLGLAIAKSIVELHGGEIMASSEPGQGTTISIRLPVER